MSTKSYIAPLMPSDEFLAANKGCDKADLVRKYQAEVIAKALKWIIPIARQDNIGFKVTIENMILDKISCPVLDISTWVKKGKEE